MVCACGHADTSLGCINRKHSGDEHKLSCVVSPSGIRSRTETRDEALAGALFRLKDPYIQYFND